MTLGPCPSFTHPDCKSPTVLAYSILPTEWGTGHVLTGGSNPPARDGKRGTFSATTVARCGAGHSVAGGARARFARRIAGEV